MGLRDLLSLPRKDRRARSKARSEVNPAEGSDIDLEALPHLEPDLEIGSSVLPTSVPSTSQNRESSGYGSKPSWKSAAYAATKLSISMAKESSDDFPPLKSVVGGLSDILVHYEKMLKSRQTIQSLMARVEGLARSISAPIPEGEVKEEERREILKRKLDDILRNLVSLEQQGKITQFLNSTEDAEKLSGLVEDIRDAMMDYQMSLQRDIFDKSRRIIESTDLALLDRMHHARDAGYRHGNGQGCMKGTRSDVLFQLERWLTDEQDERVFWLSGLAGTGKSAIAQTFAGRSFADGKLGASFFCSRDFVDRSNVQSIFPTLAFQLARRYPHFWKELLPVLRADPEAGRGSLVSQMEKLLVGPFQATQTPTLIIIDGLDECRDEESVRI